MLHLAKVLGYVSCIVLFLILLLYVLAPRKYRKEQNNSIESWLENACSWALYFRMCASTYAQTGRQDENIMPSVAHRMGGVGVKII